MITTLSFLIKNIYYFFENIIKKYKYFSDTLKGKTDSILLFHKRYEITEEKTNGVCTQNQKGSLSEDEQKL